MSLSGQIESMEIGNFKVQYLRIIWKLEMAEF